MRVIKSFLAISVIAVAGELLGAHGGELLHAHRLGGPAQTMTMDRLPNTGEAVISTSAVVGDDRASAGRPGPHQTVRLPLVRFAFGWGFRTFTGGGEFGLRWPSWAAVVFLPTLIGLAATCRRPKG